MRVWGKCDGTDILLSQKAGRWVATVPAGKGEYIIELWAEDDAGNTGYMATMLLTYDPTQLCATFKLLDIGCGWTVNSIKAALENPIKIPCVSVSIKRCDICGR